MQTAIRHWLADPGLGVSIGQPWTQPKRRPGRGGTDPRVYAVVAARYVRALKVNPRAPYPVMVQEYLEKDGVFETESALKNKVYRARQGADPVLGPASDRKAGGELTETGRRLAREMGEEA